MLFDLGGTLMHARGPWEPVHALGDHLLVECLRANGIRLEGTAFRSRLHAYYEQREKDLQETTYHFVLRELLREHGYAEVSEPVLRAALDALYAVTQANWQLEEDAPGVLRALKEKGCRLGIYSNAGDDQDVQELIESFGIRPHFDFVLTSAACFYRKPHPRAFEIALARWSIEPAEALMVGDSLGADIRGAQRVGMRTAWVRRRAQWSGEEKVHADWEMEGLEGLA